MNLYLINDTMESLLLVLGKYFHPPMKIPKVQDQKDILDSYGLGLKL